MQVDPDRYVVLDGSPTPEPTLRQMAFAYYLAHMDRAAAERETAALFDALAKPNT